MISSNVRVPKDLWDKLREISEKEERSMNAQIVYIIKKYIEQKEKDEK